MTKRNKGLLSLWIATLSLCVVAPALATTEVPILEDGNGGARIPKTLRVTPESNYGWSSFFGMRTEKDGVYECKSVDDPICTAADTTASWRYSNDLNAPKPGPTDAAIYFYHILSLCDFLNNYLCVKEVFAVSPSGERLSGKYVGKYQESSRGDFSAVPEMNLSASKGKGLLFEFDGANNSSGTNLYMLNIYTGGALSGPKKGGDSLRNYKIRMENFTSELIPIRKAAYTRGPNGEKIAPSFTKPFDSCYWSPDDSRDPDWCPVPELFPKGFRFGVTIVFPTKLSGWFHGRIESPKVDFVGSDSSTTVTFEALPISLPQLDSTIVATQIPQRYFDVLKKFSIKGGWNGPNNDGRYEITPGGAIWLKNPRFPLDMNEYFGATYEAFGDQSTYTKSVWRISSLGQEGISDRCKSEAQGFSGIVTTNALAYSSGPPEFNSQTQSLDYKVTSPHRDETGQLNRGSYDLVVESSLARCLYGLSNAPISASISVISSSGEAQVATTAVGQRDGYLYLSAQGFTYSTPTIRIKLTEDKPAQVVSSATPTPSASPQPATSAGATSRVSKVNRTSIKCLKGKQQKLFTSSGTSKPSCPKGWKKA